MLRFPARRSSLLCILLATAACSQTPSMVELKGQDNFGRSGTNTSMASNNYRSSDSYSKYAPAAGGSPRAYSKPVSQATTQSAAVDSIGVSELAPPAQSASKAKISEAAITPARINPWTGRARTGESKDESFNIRPAGKTPAPEKLVSEVNSKAKEKTVAQLDNVIASDVQKPAPKAASVSGFMWPVSSKSVISSFGPKGKGKVNDGINIASAKGEPVWAAADGEVVYTGNELQGYGNMVLIKHAGGKSTTYAHLSRMNVDKYERVKQGDIIGYVGDSGNAKKPQLHFAIRDGKEPIDPQKYLSRNVAGL